MAKQRSCAAKGKAGPAGRARMRGYADGGVTGGLDYDALARKVGHGRATELSLAQQQLDQKAVPAAAPGQAGYVDSTTAWNNSVGKGIAGGLDYDALARKVGHGEASRLLLKQQGIELEGKPSRTQPQVDTGTDAPDVAGRLPPPVSRLVGTGVEPYSFATDASGLNAMAQGVGLEPLGYGASYARGGVLDYARGGPISGGPPGRDTVPARIKGGPEIRLDNGEYALPRRTVQKVGKRNLDRLVLATNGKPPVGYQGGGQVSALEAMQGRRARIDAAVDQAVNGQPAAPVAPAPSQPMQPVPAAPAADSGRGHRSLWDIVTGRPPKYARGGQVTYGDWQPLHGELADVVQERRQRAVYGQTGAGVPQVSDAQIAAYLPNTRDLGGRSDASNQTRPVPVQPVAASAQVVGDGGTMRDYAKPRNAQVPPPGWTITSPDQLPAMTDQRLADNLAGPGRGEAQRPGSLGVDYAKLPKRSTYLEQRMPATTPITGQSMPSFGKAVGATMGVAANQIEQSAKAVGGVYEGAKQSLSDTMTDVAAGYHGVRPTTTAAQPQVPAAPLAPTPTPAPQAPKPVPAQAAAGAAQLAPALSTLAQPGRTPAEGGESGPVTYQRDAPVTAADLGAGRNRQFRESVGQLQPGMNVLPEGRTGATIYATKDANGNPIFSNVPEMATPYGLDNLQAKGNLGNVTSDYLEGATRATRELRNARREAEGSPPVGGYRAPPDMELVKLAAGREDKALDHSHQAGLKAMEVQAGMNKEQRAEAAQWDADVTKELRGIGKGNEGALGGAPPAQLSPQAQSWAMRQAQLLKRAGWNGSAGETAAILYDLGTQIPGFDELLAARTKELGLDAPTDAVRKEVKGRVDAAREAATQAVFSKFFQ